MRITSGACAFSLSSFRGCQTKPTNSFHSFGSFVPCARTIAFGSVRDVFRGVMDYAPSACDSLERGVKQSPPTRFTRSGLLLFVLAQKHLARLEMYSEAYWITRLRLVIRWKGESNKARQRASLVRLFCFLSSHKNIWLGPKTKSPRAKAGGLC
jgi:hypothetical protein